MRLNISPDLLDDVYAYAYDEETNAPLQGMMAEYLNETDYTKLLKIFSTIHEVQSDDLSTYERDQEHNKLLKPYSKLELALNIGDIAFLYGIVACWEELKSQGRV